MLPQTTDIYDPATGAWTEGPSMVDGRGYFEMVELSDGRVLAIGGAVPASYSLPAIGECELLACP